ncbi:hypothetical protein [Flocculibacter collagenilyticus]|uniref:hypothetical protein n=1 Tax=Flocculibacter collagenilyticus TaxID=2744479 RepID=UPI0018F41C55|nr:hypothetical protein [Flocculibacter collagenilyticus]
MPANAEESDVLNVDRSVASSLKLSFPNDKRIEPKTSGFNIENYVLMSNEKGERWAVITATNKAWGRRSLEHHHLMALFANGERSTPLTYRLDFEANETQSFTVSFGENKFPILSIYTRKN